MYQYIKQGSYGEEFRKKQGRNEKSLSYPLSKGQILIHPYETHFDKNMIMLISSKVIAIN